MKPVADKTHPDNPRKWNDPITNEGRMRLDRDHMDRKTGKPYSLPNAAADHVHAYNPGGTPVTLNGDPHIPTTGE